MTRASAAARRRPYHHGDLAAALVAAAEELLAERGLEGFTLREAARRAGVSHAAPAHHFGDARGLLTAVAAEGFARLAEVEREAAAKARGPERLLAIGLSYIKFALAHPALFRLMFHSDAIDRTSDLIREPGRASFDVMQDALAAARGRVSAGLIPPEAARDPLVLRQWAIVHGLATLAVEGRLGPPGAQKRFLAAARAALEASVGGLGRGR